MITKIENLNKKFYNKQVLSNINLEIEKGKIYGLLGPNGSGKTTMMRIVANLIKNTTGNVEVNELKLGKQTKNIVAFMPTSNFFPKWMKVKNAVDYYNDFYDDFDREKCIEILEKVDIEMGLKIKSLSTGMTEKFKIALTMSRNAQLILLDEPFNGIDIIAKEDIKKIIVENATEENATIISSHLIDDIEPILDEVIMIKKGEIVLNDNVEKLREEKEMSIIDIYKEVFLNV
ncbi:ABC transporter ATP-binding protein [Clostridiaceae bacterium HSG29]|nr:ABC transporter ATP-binding protein [Clostridiaceae bacterium HSG29]